MEQRETGDEGGAGKAKESKVKTPVAAPSSVWQPHQKQRTKLILKILSLDSRRCWELLKQQQDVYILVVISILFLLMKRRHLLSPLQVGVTHMLYWSLESLWTVFPKPLLALNHLCKYIQSRREEDEAACGLLDTPRKEVQDVICSALQSWEQVSLKLMQLSTMVFKEERGPGVCFGRHNRSYAVVVYPCPSWVTNGLCEPQGPLFQALHSPAEANADCSLRGRRGKENGNILWWKQVTLECFSPQSFLLFLFHP